MLARALAAAMLMIPAAAAAQPAKHLIEMECCWAGVGVDQPRDRQRPLSLDFHLLDFGLINAGQTLALRLPLLTFGFDLRRPAGDHGAASLSFVQAPLLLFLLGGPLLEPEKTPALATVAGALLWLSGGTLRFMPGGLGNLRDDGRNLLSFALEARSVFDVHPFTLPVYVRETAGLGISVRGDDRRYGRHVFTDWECELRAFASAARDWQGARTLDTGLGATCSVGFLPLD